MITGDMQVYAPAASRAFKRYEIPCFIDEKHSVFLNPFVEYLRAAVDMIVENFSYESVFRMLRCGLNDISTEEADRLENYVIADGKFEVFPLATRMGEKLQGRKSGRMCTN